MKIWKTFIIYFQFHLILVVNVDRVYILCQSKGFEKNPVCPQKNERQQSRPVIDGKRRKKRRTGSSESPMILKSKEKKSVVSRIE